MNTDIPKNFNMYRINAVRGQEGWVHNNSHLIAEDVGPPSLSTRSVLRWLRDMMDLGSETNGLFGVEFIEGDPYMIEISYRNSGEPIYLLKEASAE